MSLLLKKINDDLEFLKESLNIVRENPQFMANELLSNAIQKLDNGQFNEVRFVSVQKFDIYISGFEAL